MRGLLVASIFTILTLSGCLGLVSEPQASDDAQTGVPDPVPAAVCPSESLRTSAYDAGYAYLNEKVLAFEVPFAMTLVGTLEGEVGSVLLKADPSRDAIHLRDSEGTAVVVGPYWSVDSLEETHYSRDHDPKVYADFKAYLAEDDASELSFLDDLTVDDYEATCKTLSGVAVVEYHYEAEGLVDVFVVEEAYPHRPVSGRSVDPQLQDNYRVSITYQTPEVKLDESLPRAPLMWDLEADNQYINERGGTYLDATFTENTEWAPLEELEFHLVDGDGVVYVAEDLTADAWDMGDGDYFEFRDKDKNQMLSAGDEMIMDVGPGLDIMFYDKWADAYTV